MARDIFLKIKLKQLASEARDIRREERKQIVRKPRLDEEGRPAIKMRPEPDPSTKRPRLAADGHVVYRTIPLFETKIGELLPELHSHRVHVVRREARDTQLAYAFVRGKLYATVESGATTHPDWENVKRMIIKYGSYEFQYGRAGEMLAWIKGAREIIEANAAPLKRT